MRAQHVFVQMRNEILQIRQATQRSFPVVYENVDVFSNGLALVFLDKKFGFINKAGNVVIPLIYDYASGFSNGLARVYLDGE